MLIRDLTWREMPMWPPEWGILDHGVGEEGVLVNVQLRNDLKPACIFVVANYLDDIRKVLLPDILLAWCFLITNSKGTLASY